MTTANEYQVSKILTLGVAFAPVYTVSFARWSTIKNIHIANSSAGAVAVKVCFVFQGLTPLQGNAALWNFSVPGNDFIEYGEGIKLPPGTSVQGLAASANVINLWLSATEAVLSSA